MSLNLEELRLSSQAPLRDCARSPCPSCGKSCSAYCCDCLINLCPDTPRLLLPVKVDVVLHGETNARGTGLHAVLLAPEDVQLHRHDSGSTGGHHRRQDPQDLKLPEYDPATTVVLFPESEGTDVVGQCPPFERVVVLDGSWRKAHSMLAHPSLQGLRKVQLPRSVRTVFWRRGAGDFRGAVEEGVSTIESVLWLCACLDPEGNYDDLLWYFSWIHSKVQDNGGPPRTRKKLPRQKGRRAKQRGVNTQETASASGEAEADTGRLPREGGGAQAGCARPQVDAEAAVGGPQEGENLQRLIGQESSIGEGHPGMGEAAPQLEQLGGDMPAGI